MTSQPEPAPSRVNQARQITGSLRELAAVALLGGNALLLFVGVIDLAVPFSESSTFSDRAGGAFFNFVGVEGIVLPLLAVLLATHFEPSVGRARLITLTALVEYAVSVVFGVLALLVWIFGRMVEGEFRDAFTGLLVRGAFFAMLAIAGYAVFRIWHALFHVPRPQGQPGVYGHPQHYGQGYPQQGYPQAPQSYGQPGPYPGVAGPASAPPASGPHYPAASAFGPPASAPPYSVPPASAPLYPTATYPPAPASAGPAQPAPADPSAVDTSAVDRPDAGTDATDAGATFPIGGGARAGTDGGSVEPESSESTQVIPRPGVAGSEPDSAEQTQLIIPASRQPVAGGDPEPDERTQLINPASQQPSAGSRPPAAELGDDEPTERHGR